jgi:hypothetical protein
MTVDIDDIPEFGRIDAESEDQLAHFFLRTEAYRRVEDQEHIVVAGRKGTGKTAIYEALLERSGGLFNVFAKGLKFRDYPWGVHDQVKDTDAAPVERYTQSWVFLLMVELAKLVLQDQSHAVGRHDDEAKARQALEKFIANNWGAVGFEHKDIFRKKKYSFDFNPQIAGTGLGALSRDDVPREQLAGILVEANRWLMACLQHILDSGNWYFVLVDELDTGYSPQDEEYAQRLIGLLLAAREVFLWAQQNDFSVAPLSS